MQETFTNTTFVHHIYMCTYVHPCPFFRFTNQHPHFLTFTTTHSIFNFEILIWNTIKFYGRHLPLHWLHDERVRGWVSGLVLCVCVSVWMLEIPQWQQHLVLKSLLRKQDIFIWRNIHTHKYVRSKTLKRTHCKSKILYLFQRFWPSKNEPMMIDIKIRISELTLMK